MTTIIFEPRYLHEYSKLPIAFLQATFPAKRTLKISPKLWSKINSSEVLESLQPNTAAKGSCFLLTLHELMINSDHASHH